MKRTMGTVLALRGANITGTITLVTGLEEQDCPLWGLHRLSWDEGSENDSAVSFPGGLRLMGNRQMSPEHHGEWPFKCSGWL